MPFWPWKAAGGLALAGMLFLAAAPCPAATGSPGGLLAQSDALQASDPERALELARTAREQARDEPARLAAEVKMAALHRLLTDYAAATELAEKGLARATELKHAPLMAGFRYVLARIQWNLGNYQSALELYLATLRQAEEIGDRELAFDAHCGVSTLFGDFKQPEQAFYHLEQARLIAEQLGDKVRLGDLHKIIGNNALGRRDYPRALAEHQRSLQLHTEAGSDRGIADALQNLGHTNEQLGKLDLALEQTHRSIATYRPLGLRRHLVNAMRQSGRLLVKLGRADEGVKELEEALRLTQELKAISLTAYAYRELARAYEVQGNIAAAYQAQQKLVTTNEAVFNERSSQQLAILNSHYIAERRQMEIDLLRRDQALKAAELARSRSERRWLLVVAGAGVVALGAIAWGLRMRLVAQRRIVTESHAAKEAAEQADRLKTRLLGIASHDLKNPLSSVMGGLEELRETVPEQEPLIGILLGESERMRELIHDLIDHAALEAGQLRLASARVDLAALVNDVVAAQQARARAKGIALTVGANAPANLAIKGDATRLRQVFVNLVDNALKFTPAGGAVTVGLQAGAAGHVSVSVTDTGPGMTPRDMDNLFTPFNQLSAKPTGGESSTGLGLSICHELVTLHQGRITVRSEIGRGTTFTVVLPAGSAPGGGSRPPQ